MPQEVYFVGLVSQLLICMYWRHQIDYRGLIFEIISKVKRSFLKFFTRSIGIRAGFFESLDCLSWLKVEDSRETGSCRANESIVQYCS